DHEPALAVLLGLLAVVGVGDGPAVVGREGDRRGGGERNALVGGAEDQVELETRAHDGGGIAASEHGRRLAVAEEPGIEEIGAVASGLEPELPAAQSLALKRE